MSLSKPAKTGVAALGGAALLGWGSAFYMWNQPKTELVQVAAASDEAGAGTEGGQEIAKQLDELKAEISKAETDLETKGEEISEAERHLAEVKSDLEVNQSQLEEVEGELDQGKAAIDQHKLELAALREDHTSVEKAIAKARSALDDATSKLDTPDAADQEAGSDPKDDLAQEPLTLDPVMTAVPVQTPMGVRVSLVHFDRGSADVSPGGKRKADEVAAWIKANGAEAIQVQGFADTRGTKEDNKELSERRARSVAALLEDAGIDQSSIEIISHGEDKLPEVTEDQISEPLNRCVGIFITPKADETTG